MNNLKIKPAKEMSIEELIGQVIMIGLPFDYLEVVVVAFVQDEIYFAA